METIKLIGIILTFIIGVVNVVVTVTNNNKNLFINTVTNARKEYFQELRKLVAEFAFIATNTDVDDNQKLEQLAFQIKLMMNPAKFPECWDGYAVNLIDEIIENPKEKENEIQQLVALMQSWLALEWHGMMTEGKGGNLTEKEKVALRKKHWKEFSLYSKTLNN
ncbi:hypothetical protein AGMMS49965_10490 [Bacteroidia bacterium]|nr:hypothetical protein AGMMS49965_10490 [Bacteroidia bacterium]